MTLCLSPVPVPVLVPGPVLLLLSGESRVDLTSLCRDHLLPGSILHAIPPTIVVPRTSVRIVSFPPQPCPTQPNPTLPSFLLLYPRQLLLHPCLLGQYSIHAFSCPLGHRDVHSLVCSMSIPMKFSSTSVF
ncbi:hypothetical protein BDZ45DRAFT_19321 [Acephala macrosclerotiorum]|nr:hypothetical protein BDZ45DRAFT_19321 [Acephala macrosclerotiorum]